MPGKVPETIQTRPAKAEDCEAILTLVNGLAAFHGDTATLTADALLRDAFSPAPWVQVLVAERHGKVSGYTALVPHVQLQFGQRALDIHHLFVSETARGAGTGTALINAAVQRARELHCSRLTVGTDPDNLQAQGFYLSQGFQRRPSFPPRFALAVSGNPAT